MLNYRTAFVVSVAIAFFGCEAQDSPSESAVTANDTISIIHLNDTYRVGGVEEGRRGGFGRVGTIASGLSDQGNDVLITHGGDLLFPSLESQLWAGAQMIEAMNYLAAIAPVYFVPGNHEFDERRPNAVINAIRDSKFVWLADNLRLETGESDVDGLLKSAHVVTVGKRRIGMFGITLLPRDGGNSRDYAPVDGEYLETASEAIRGLEEAGAEVIIGLTHLHLADDRKVAELKAKHPRFLFIVGGHEHEPEFEQGSETRAAIFKGASNARVVWQLDLDFTGPEPALVSSLIDLNSDVAEDPVYVEIADRWRARLLEKIPFLPSDIGIAAVPLDAREVTIRNYESNWGNFIADQMPGAFGKPPADFAFVNSGTLRIDDFISEGITFEDVGRTFGFSSFLRHMTINGGDFIALLEAGYRGEGPSKGYFPQISGFRVCIDRTRPDGARIVQFQVPVANGWQQIKPDADYKLVAPDYLYGGGDGYDFSNARDVSRPGSELKYLVLDGIIRAQAVGEKVGASVDPTNPRIAFAPAPGEVCFTE